MSYDVNINKSKVTNSFFWKMTERIMSQGVNLLVQIILARILLPEHFGSLAIIAALTNYANIFVQSGISTVIVQKKELNKEDLSTLQTFSLAVALFFYSILFFAAPFIASYYNSAILSPALRVISLMLFLNAITAVQTGVLSRQMRFKAIFMRTMVAVPLSGVVGIVMAIKGFGLWALVAHSIVNALVIVVLMSFDKELRIPLGFSWKRFKPLFSFSGKVMLTSLVSGGHDFIRTMMIGKKYSTEQLAFYDKGYTYSSMVSSVIRQSIGSVLLPAFSRQQDDIQTLRNMARRSVRLASFILFPVLVAVAMMAEPLVVLLLTEKWLACVPFLAIFCILRIPGPIISVDNQVYYALGKSELNLYYEIGLFVVNVSVLLVTVQISVMAIAVGALIVEFLGLLAIFVISSRLYGYTLGQRISDIWKPGISTIIMGLFIYAISILGLSYWLTLIIQLCGGIAVYTMMSMLLKDDSFDYCIDLLRETIKNK